MMLKCFNWLETRQTRRWYPPLTWMKMDDVFPLSFTVQKWRQNIGYKCYQEFIEVYFEFHLPDISGGSGLWSILQPTYRGQSRCFGSVFGKMSCYLFIYSHLFKDGLWSVKKNKEEGKQAHNLLSHSMTSNYCIMVEPRPESQSCPPPAEMITLEDFISNMPNTVIKLIV